MKTREKVKLFFLFIFYCVITQQVFAQKRTISGTVTSADEKEALIGVSITIKGNEAIGTITDPEGKYSLQVEPDQTLIVSYIGMKTAEIRVPRKNSVLNIVLEPESMNLDEVVVTGYGNFTKSSFTGSANTLKADMLKDIPVECGTETARYDNRCQYYQQFWPAGSQPEYPYPRYGIF